ncbi:uncharacterized protein CHSO_1078 [Chryseobacterium sp. StRB126]|uniref:hypothetical protein n=1 Tax=Chryseobacterium sp. StRB126 TaxID=878220 RepID=UPI0004E98F22|nr:hypothetical protein [Chryseobacterium sp. StRB126]BAP30115.1 uncharacterized protein CHSO_1078 [Chryseobacterium sp. StRB126]
MALRIRKTGEIYCAAKSEPEEGDTYIDDGIHYYLSQLTGAIIASENHEEDGLWFWNILPDKIEHFKEITENEKLKSTVAFKKEMV